MHVQVIQNTDRNTCTVVIDGDVYAGSCERGNVKADGVQMSIDCYVDLLAAAAPADVEAAGD